MGSTPKYSPSKDGSRCTTYAALWRQILLRVDKELSEINEFKEIKEFSEFKDKQITNFPNLPKFPKLTIKT